MGQDDVLRVRDGRSVRKRSSVYGILRFELESVDGVGPGWGGLLGAEW
jgi:hypothetical protein